MADHLTTIYLRMRNNNTTFTIADNSFGPFLDIPGKETFDFTLLFEESILSILPSALLLLIVPWRLWKLRNVNRKVKHGHLQTLKLVCFIPSNLRKSPHKF